MTNRTQQRCVRIQQLKQDLSHLLPTSILHPSQSQDLDRRATLAQYAIASLQHFLPIIKIDQCERIVRNLFLSQAIASMDERACFSDLNIKIDDVHCTLKSSKSSANIFATFHSASYRCIGRLMVRNQIRYVVPVTADVYTAQRTQILDDLQADSVKDGQVVIINVEDRGSLLHLVKLLRHGYSMLIYVDGNAGAEGMHPSHAKPVLINIFGKLLYARRGIYEIARIARVPIVPAISHYVFGSFQPCITFSKPINIGPSLDATTLLQDLYSVLTPYILENPWIWEAWLYLFRFIPAIPARTPFAIHKICNHGKEKFVFDYQNYALIRPSASQIWLLNRRKFSVMLVDKRVSNLLLDAAAGKLFEPGQLKGTLLTALERLGCCRQAE